jgi:2-methylfumaryl-CoA isomerase
VLNELFAEWFGAHTATEVSASLAATSVLWERYQSFTEVVNSPRVTANPLFTPLQQDRIGRYPAPGLPMSVDGVHVAAQPAPALGQDNATVPAEWLGE